MTRVITHLRNISLNQRILTHLSIPLSIDCNSPCGLKHSCYAVCFLIVALTKGPGSWVPTPCGEIDYICQTQIESNNRAV